jgi:hypothetical protein
VLQFECLCRLLSSMGSDLVTRELLSIIVLMLLKVFTYHHPDRIHLYSELMYVSSVTGSLRYVKNIS